MNTVTEIAPVITAANEALRMLKRDQINGAAVLRIA